MQLVRTVIALVLALCFTATAVLAMESAVGKDVHVKHCVNNKGTCSTGCSNHVIKSDGPCFKNEDTQLSVKFKCTSSGVEFQYWNQKCTISTTQWFPATECTHMGTDNFHVSC